MKGSTGLAFGVLILLALGCVCGNSGEKEMSQSRNTQTPVTPPTAASSAVTKPELGYFAPGAICSLPREAAPGSPFASLGGGTWDRWGDEGGELDYGCEGGTDDIKLLDDGGNSITAEYGAIGGPNAVHYLSVEYTAFQLTGQTTTEKRLRRQYADFCDKLSEKFYGKKLPAKFRARLLDESTYSSSGIANEYAEKVGSGYVNLSSNKNGSQMIMLDVHFFSSEVEYKTYKDE